MTMEEYLAYLGWDGTQDQYGRDYDTIMRDTVQYGADAATYEDRVALVDLAESYLSSLSPTESPTVNGMADDGGQYYGDQSDPTNTGNITDQPWYDEYQQQYEQNYNNPQWNTGQSVAGGGNVVGEGGGMEWDWGRFGTQTPIGGFGDYFADYDASAQYSPGEDASWGSENFPGNNRDFYQNQFGNLLQQSQGMQSAQRAAAIRQSQAAEQPAPEFNADWSWIEGGLPQVEVMENGYAKPLAGLNLEQGGYQQGGAVYGWNPMTGMPYLYDGSGGTTVDAQ